MISIRAVFFILIGLNIMAIALISLNRNEGKFIAKSIPTNMNLQTVKEIKNSYLFDDPFKAFYLLEMLDKFSVVEANDVAGSNYTSTGGAFTVNFDYCNEHRAHFVNHPESIFEEKNFLTNYWKAHKIRSEVINKIGNDVLPELVPQTSYPKKFDMTTDTGIFFIRNLYFYWRQVGKQFACLTQAFNHIPGHDKIYKKDSASVALVEYAKTYSSRAQCFNYDKHFPKTWVLKIKESCEDFFEEFNSPRYQKLKKERNVVYFRKIGADVHQGQGVFPVTEKEEESIRKLYGNGTLCGKVKDNNLIQYNVWNSLLVQKRKPGFRVFMLVASTNPVIAYYHDGYVRLSLNEYDLTSNDAGTFVTNIHVNLHEAQAGMNAFQGMTEAQINEHTCWFYDKFHKYLVEEGFVSDPNWIDNYLRREFKKVMVHIIRMASSGFAKKSSVYELYGLDFVMDENLQVWYIEGNAMPLIDGFTPASTILMNRMLSDSFEIIYGLIRSRAKRIITYINKLTKETDGLDIPDLEAKREEFKELSKNRFEPEFEPSPQNTFHKIVDDNEIGVKRYAGLIEEECL